MKSEGRQTDSDCTICVTNDGDIANVDVDFDLSDISVSSEGTVDLTDFDSLSAPDNGDVDVHVDDNNNTFSNVLKPVVLQPFTQEIGTNHALDDTAIELDYFCLLFTDDMLEMIVVQTNLYAHQSIAIKPDPSWHDTTKEEMRAFIGLNMLMGIVVMPELHLYWSGDANFGKLKIQMP